MKTKIITTLVGCSMLFSCNDSFLDRPPLDAVTDANYWQSEAHLESAANALYTGLVGKDILNMFEAMGESAPWSAVTAYRTIGGGNYATDIAQVNNFWGRGYTNIGQCYYFLENYEKAVNVTEDIRERYAAEAYFFLAYEYWRLTALFGDVPYIDHVLNVDDPDVFRGRDPKEDIIEVITKELEEHYQNLPTTIDAASSTFGRISQAAALTLLSRIYLYNEMWAEAADAAERGIALGYHELYSTGDPTCDYVNLFNFTGRASRVAANKETILAFVYNFDLGDDARTNHNLSRELWVPNDYSRFVPTKSMVECYLKSDGTLWNPDECTSYEEVFVDRDPRMAQSLLVPGMSWEGGVDGNPNNDDSSIFTYPKFNNTKDGCMTSTGYYLRKYVEPSKVGQVSQDDNDIIIFRYAELLLNLAEAKEQQNLLTQDVVDNTINLLRDRVGMVHLDINNLPEGSTLQEEVRRERRIELFFEGQRYLDIIRWKEGWRLGDDLLGVKKSWIDLDKIDLSSSDLDALNWNTDGYLILESGRTFEDPKHYLLSLPSTQMLRNPALTPNNTGW